MVDSDGSITGTCGSVIVGLGAQLRLPGCVEKPEWNAAVCPPNQVPLQNVGFEDGNDQNRVTGVLEDVRAQIGGKLVRLHDHAMVVLDPRQKDSYDYGNGTTEITAAMEYMTNLRMYYDHLLMFGPDGSKTPNKVNIVFAYIEGGTWMRLAIPYPSGTTFSIIAWYGDDVMTPVNSKDELDSLKYYYDDATQLLWLHITAPDTVYAWYHGKLHALSLFVS